MAFDRPPGSQDLVRGELVKLLYRLGCQQASGVLTVRVPRLSVDRPGGASGEMFVLRRGAIVVGEGELARRLQSARLASLLAVDRLTIDPTPHSLFPRQGLPGVVGSAAHAGGAGVIAFHGGVNACPPGPQQQIALASWIRTHVEAELDNSLADRVMRSLAGMRLSIRAALVPTPADEADRRLLSAMDKPRRLDQIWPLARTSRFRILAFLHFLHRVDALEAQGLVAEQSGPHRRLVGDRRHAAAALLGVGPDAGHDAIKRAYRRLARSLHPDLQPHTDEARRRRLEQRFAEVTAAYETLL